MFFSFSPTEILYISSRVMYVFRFNFSFCVNNGLEKKITYTRPSDILIWTIAMQKQFERNKYLQARKFYIRRNNNKVDSVKTGSTVIAHLLPWSDLEKCMYTTLF